MREAFDRLLRHRALVALALGIALGWTLIQVAEGFSTLVTGLLYEIDTSDDSSPFNAPYSLQAYGEVLAWNVGGRILSLGALVAGLVQLGVVLGVALLVYRRSRANARQDTAEPS